MNLLIQYFSAQPWYWEYTYGVREINSKNGGVKWVD